MKPVRTCWMELAVTLLLTGFVTSCSIPARIPVRPHTADVGQESTTTLQASIDDIRQALRRWDWQGLSDAAARCLSIEPEDANEAFLQDYWRGTALFHAVLALSERPPDTPAASHWQSQHKEAVTALNAVLTHRPNDSDSHAMLATLYGMTLQRQPTRALTLGPLWLRHRRAARAAWASNPRVSYLEGVSLLRRARDTQAVSDALNTLLHAERLFDEAARTPRPFWQPVWGRAHNGMFIGEAYEILDQPTMATEWFMRAYRAMPGLARAKMSYERCRIKMENTLLSSAPD